MENLHGVMEDSIKDSGKMESNKVKVFTQELIKLFVRENGQQDKSYNVIEIFITFISFYLIINI